MVKENLKNGRKNKLLTIGQFAAIHGINKKTLMWYDEIDLFKPAVIHPENGYRFYSYRQSSILETILLLRELDVPIAEIQEFMKNRSALGFKHLLKERIKELDSKIQHLKSIRESLRTQHENMVTLLTMDLSEIRVTEKEERCLITLEIDENTAFDRQVEMITAETKKYGLRRFHDAVYGTMIHTRCLYKEEFGQYSRLFIALPFPAEKHQTLKKHPGSQDGRLHIQPGGLYLQAFHKGSFDGIPAKYKEMLAYAKNHGLRFTGFSYETGMNEAVIDHENDYITQIEIPVIQTILLPLWKEGSRK